MPSSDKKLFRMKDVLAGTVATCGWLRRIGVFKGAHATRPLSLSIFIPGLPAQRVSRRVGEKIKKSQEPFT